MVFFIVAIDDKQNKGDAAVEQRLRTRCASFQDQRPGHPEVHSIKVDKTQFKVSSLDQLMTLNETTAKLDSQLEVLTKKFEKVAMDTGTKQFFFDEESSTSYLDYIKKFEWDVHRYSYKRSLLELVATIQKKMKTKDEMLKKQQEEYNNVRSKLASMSKKDGGNFLVRDFTDDIYNQVADAGLFAESHNSTWFTNMIAVLPKGKLEQFKAEIATVLEEYYAYIDSTELKRIPEQVKALIHDYEEMDNDALNLIAERIGVRAPNAKDTEALKEFIIKELEYKLKKKQQSRMPSAIVPHAVTNLGLEDKDQNQLFRIVVYKPQADDVTKAARRKGYTIKEFAYNKNQWVADNEKRQLLQEEVENKQTTLNQVAEDNMADLFIALMHLKVIRAYIDGVMRFGIPPKFYTGVIIPRKGAEKKMLTDMSALFAEQDLSEMYGEKIEGSGESDDFWPFVSIQLQSPAHVHKID